MKALRSGTIVGIAVVCASAILLAAAILIRNLLPFRDATGFVATYNVHGDTDESNSVFQQLGTNGRTCATCHQFDQAMSLEVNHIRRRFEQTAGKDPLFAPVDGANCPNAEQALAENFLTGRVALTFSELLRIA